MSGCAKFALCFPLLDTHIHAHKYNMVHVEDLKELCVQQVAEVCGFGFPLAVSPCGTLIALMVPDNQVCFIETFTGIVTHTVCLPKWVEPIDCENKIAFMKDVDQSPYFLVSGFLSMSVKNTALIFDIKSGAHVGNVGCTVAPSAAFSYSSEANDLAVETGLVAMCRCEFLGSGERKAFVRLYHGKGVTWSLLREIVSSEVLFSLLCFSTLAEIAVFDEERAVVTFYDISTGVQARELCASAMYAFVSVDERREYEVRSMHACVDGSFLFAGVGKHGKLVAIDNHGQVVFQDRAPGSMAAGCDHLIPVAIIPGVGLVTRVQEQVILAARADAIRKATMSPLRVQWIHLVVTFSHTLFT